MQSYREKQIVQLISFVKNKVQENRKNNRNGIHIITGSFYTNKIQSEGLIDVVQYHNSNIKIDTDDYIYIYLNKANLDLLEYLKENFNVKNLTVFIREELNHLQNYPIEMNLHFIKENESDSKKLESANQEDSKSN